VNGFHLDVMSGIFGTEAPLSSDISLLLQIIILILLLWGVKLGKEKTEKSLRRHGMVMALVVTLNAMGMVFVMVPSFVGYFSNPLPKLSTFGVVSTALHAFFGGLAEVFGIAFVLNKKPKDLRFWMRITTLFWMFALVLGFSLYLQVAGVV